MAYGRFRFIVLDKYNFCLILVTKGLQELNCQIWKGHVVIFANNYDKKNAIRH